MFKHNKGLQYTVRVAEPAERTRSNPGVDALTGADLGAGPGAGRTTELN